MTIRRATETDLPALVQMGLKFASLEYRDSLLATEESLLKFAWLVLKDDQSVLMLSEDDDGITGMIGATVYVQPMSGETIGTELVWWMEPERRGKPTAMKLLRAVEDWARELGATKFQMIAPSDHVGRFYERIGFQRLETHYQRSLT